MSLSLNNGLLRRLLALESDRQLRTPSQPHELRVEDDEFFSYMFARALIGDRGWEPAEQVRYHNILLGETDE